MGIGLLAVGFSLIALNAKESIRERKNHGSIPNCYGDDHIEVFISDGGRRVDRNALNA